jgi:ubiquitin-protein ligase
MDRKNPVGPTKDEDGDAIPVTDSRRSRMMMSQYKEFHKRASPHQIAIPDEKNMNTWYVLICGLDGIHEFAEYIIKFKAGEEFPQKAPKNFRVLTENGVFEMGGPICISLGEWHDRDAGRMDIWRPSLGMTGFAENVVSAFICYQSLEGGIRIRYYDAGNATAVKKYQTQATRMAKNSHKFNFVHSPGIMAKVEEFVQTYPDNPAVRNLVAQRAKLYSGSRTKVRSGPTALGATKPPNAKDAHDHKKGAGASMRPADSHKEAQAPALAPSQPPGGEKSAQEASHDDLDSYICELLGEAA